MDKLKADGVNNGRVRDDDFLAELAIPFREESGRPFSRELRSSDPGPYLHWRRRMVLVRRVSRPQAGNRLVITVRW